MDHCKFCISTFFSLALLLMLICQTDARENIKDYKREMKMMDGPRAVTLNCKTHDDGPVQSSPSGSCDLYLRIFFLEEDLRIGKKMPIYFPKRNMHASPPLLPREDASSIPFSSTQLASILQKFSIVEGSPQAQAMEYTLNQCETKAMMGERKLCATSLESMLAFVRDSFGVGADVHVLVTTYNKQPNAESHHPLLQNYTVLGLPLEVVVPSMVACHTMPYPYKVFYCHNQITANKVFKVTLEGQNGDRVQAIAVCHMDTSKWDQNHPSFGALGIKPGSAPVCHFFAEDHLVWVPSFAYM